MQFQLIFCGKTNKVLQNTKLNNDEIITTPCTTTACTP